MMICATATNGASSWRYSPASAANAAIRNSTLYIGLRWPMTIAEANTASPASAQNVTTSVIEIEDQRSRRDQVDDRRRKQELPAEPHQLVVAVSRQRPPHPDVGEENRSDLQEERHPAQTVRVEQRDAVPAAQIQVRRHRRHRRHVDVLGMREQREADRAVFRVVAGDPFMLGLGELERRAVRLGEAGDDVDDEAE